MINKRLLLLFFLCLGIDSVAQQKGQINAFIYHRFGDDRFPSTNTSLEKFEAHLQTLKTSEIQVLTMSQAMKALDKKGNELEHTSVITIDDGFKSFYENAFPLLVKYQLPATLYINTETVGATDYMTWEEINEVKAAGIEIGNHSHSHNYFLNEDTHLTDFKEDLILSDSLITHHIGQKPVTYAYPYGEWSIEMSDVLRDMGYNSAAAQNSGVIGVKSHKYHLPRFPMSETYAKQRDFAAKLKVGPLNVDQIEVISDGYLGSPSKPRLILSFEENNLSLENLQCFVQGSKCKKSIQVVKNDIVKLTIWPEKELSKRRTLFTITAKDHSGRWHWFSYVWLMADKTE